jgi:hypothetical protein
MFIIGELIVAYFSDLCDSKHSLSAAFEFLLIPRIYKYTGSENCSKLLALNLNNMVLCINIKSAA